MKGSAYRRPPQGRALLAVAFCLCLPLLGAQEAITVVPKPAPGLYSLPQLVSFALPKDTRLTVSVDGSPFYEPVSPVLLNTDEGTDKTFVVDVELRSLLPDSPVLVSQRLIWRIDRKPPQIPVFTSHKTTGGRLVTMTLSESGNVLYRLYHPFSGASGTAVVPSGSKVFLPDGAAMCANGIDAAGNRGPVGSPSPLWRDVGERPYRVINPVPGTWSNGQALLVDFDSGTDIFYSLDGSDPLVSGQAYSDPVLLPANGPVSLRIAAIGQDGQRYAERIEYSVEPKDAPASLSLSVDGSLLETGEIRELGIPQNLTYTIGDTQASEPGGRPVSIGSVRGTRRYFPLTVSDGSSKWRWVCASGSVPSAKPNEEVKAAEATVPVAMTAPEAGPSLVIQDWYFISFKSTVPVYYSLDGKSWKPYDTTFFVDRSRDNTVYWYSSQWNNAAVQTARLPAKPRLNGVPPKSATSVPPLISVTESPFVFYYQVGTEYLPPAPDAASPKLGNGLLCDVPVGASATFSFRAIAVLDGIVHGELDALFTVDRKPPRVPSPGILSDTAYSRQPLVLLPTGEETIKVSIVPPLYTFDGKRYTLTGDTNKPVQYAISLYSVDSAGNLSATVNRSVTVDLNALYVDAEASVQAVRDGTPTAPYETLDQALSAVKGSARWRIYVRGTVILNQAHTLRAKISIIGKDAVIQAGKEAAVLVSEGSMSLSDVSVIQNQTDLFPVLFDIRKGQFQATNVSVVRSRTQSGTMLRAVESLIICTGSTFESTDDEYAVLFDIRQSKLSLERCRLTASAPNSSLVSLTGSTADISHCSLVSSGGSAGRAVEVWKSSLSISDTNLERLSALTVNRDTAIWLDADSRLQAASSLAVKGFWRVSLTEAK